LSSGSNASPSQLGKGRTESNVVTVGTSAQRLVRPNPQRRELIIQNRGTSDIFIDNTENPSTTTSLIVQSDGGEVVLLKEEDGDLVIDKWVAISTVAGQSVKVIEVLDYK